MKKVVTFGEIMLRLTPEGYNRFQNTDRFLAYYGGSEANAAVTLAELGAESRFVTKLPAHAIGEGAVRFLRKSGVDTSCVLRGGDRVGIYFLEKGTAQRPAKTIYDRKNSAMALAKADEFDWNTAFRDACWFHFSGITPAISDELASATLEACRTAKKLGLTVSCDLNYRSMWSPEKARSVMDEILPYVDVFIANDKDVLGMYDNLSWKAEDPRERAEEILKAMTARFGFREAAMILVLSRSPYDKSTWATLLEDGNLYRSKEYFAEMVESVGAGDTFAGAFIAAELKNMTKEEKINFSAAVSALKFSVPGDANLTNEAEARQLMERSGDDWIKR